MRFDRLFGRDQDEEYFWNKELFAEFTMHLPDAVVSELMEISNRHHITVGELLKKFLIFGMVGMNIKDKGGSIVVTRPEEGSEPLELFLFDDQEDDDN